jgi:hypothetical protein
VTQITLGYRRHGLLNGKGLHASNSTPRGLRRGAQHLVGLMRRFVPTGKHLRFCIAESNGAKR